MCNIFLEKSYTKCGGETILRPFSKKWKLSISLDQYSKVLHILFLLFAKFRTIESDWLELTCRSLAFTSYKTFLKNRKWSGTSLPASFSAWVLKKNITVVIFYYLTKFQSLVAITSWDIGQYVIVCWPCCDIKNFEINLIILIKLFLQHDQKVKTKI